MVKLDIHAAELVARRLNQTRDLAHYVGVGAKVWPLWFGRPPRPVTKEQEENLKKYLQFLTFCREAEELSKRVMEELT